MLVQGTSKSTLASANGNPNGRVLNSSEVKCWSSMDDQGSTFNLRSYRHEDALLDFTLNKNAALVWVSGVLPGDPPTYVVHRLELVEPQGYKNAVEFIRASIRVASKTRMPIDAQGVLELISPQHLKRCRVVGRWPSDIAPPSDSAP